MKASKTELPLRRTLLFASHHYSWKYELYLRGLLFDFHIYSHPGRKDILQQARICKAKLQHVWRWKEMEDGGALTVPAYDKLMTDSGIEAEKIDEGLGAVKGQLEARAKRAKQ